MPYQPKPIDPQRLAEIRIRCTRALADDPRSPIGEDLQDLLAEIDRLTAPHPFHNPGAAAEGMAS